MRILVVDDDAALSSLVQARLRHEGFETKGSLNATGAVEWLQQHPVDLIVLDLSLPDGHGRHVLDDLERTGKRVPFIVVTGHGDEKIAVEMMKRGALDYLVKDERLLSLLPLVVHRAMDHIGRKVRLDRAETRLRLVESAVNHVSDGLMIVEGSGAYLDGKIIFVNPALLDMTGLSEERVVGRTAGDLAPDAETRASWASSFASLTDEQVCRVTMRYESASGSAYEVEETITPLRDGSDKVTHWVVVRHPIGAW